MLEYDNERHVINDFDNQVDFTIRLNQFFDHYLKDAPAPVWMTKGIPYKMKGIVRGLELEDKIKTPVATK